MSHEIAQSPPPVGVGAVHGRPHTGRAEAQKGLRNLAIVSRHQGDSWDGGELADEAGDGRQLLAVTAMHGDHDSVHAPRARNLQGLAQRFGVEGVEATVADGIDAWAFGGGEDGADGDHCAVTVTSGNQGHVNLSYAMTNPRVPPHRLLIGLGSLVVILMVGGAVSFVRYARSHAPNPALVAVAPFDIFAKPELDRWRVGLATALTERLDSAPLAAVPQSVVAATWRSAPTPEIAAVELARQAGAGLAVYARVDSLPGTTDSVRVSLVAIDATTTKVLFGVLLRWPTADPDGLARSLAEHVRHNHPIKAAT